MAVVTFPNGKSVTFQGTPSPADVDYVAKQMGITAQPQGNILSDIGGGAKWLANAVLSPAESLGTHLGEGAAGLTADALDAMHVAPGEVAKIRGRLADPSTAKTLLGNTLDKNFTGGDVSALKPGLGGALQVGGDALATGASLIAPGELNVAKGAALGAASGLGQSLSEGTTDASKLVGDTASGGIFGGVLGGASSALGHVAAGLKGATGVTPQVENELRQVTPNLVQNYADAAMAHETNAAAPTAFNVAEKAFEDRASILTNKLIPEAGEELGKVRDAAGQAPIMIKTPGKAPVAGINAVNEISDNINNVMQKLTRHEFANYGSDAAGFKINNYSEGVPASAGGHMEGIISALPGRAVDLSKAEVGQLEYLGKQLQMLQENPSLQTAMDIKTNLNSEVGKWDNPQFGSGNSPVKGVLKYAYGQVSHAISSVSPEVAAATDNYSALQSLKDAIAGQAGQDGQNASLMMRRVLSGDKSSTVIPLLQQLDALTAKYRPQGDPSLISHSVLSDWATKNFGGSTGKTLLNQYTAEGSSLFGYARTAVGTVLKETLKVLTPDKLAFAKSVAKGDPQSMNVVTRLAQQVMDSTESVPLINKVTKSLNAHGINPNTAVPIVEKLIQAAILNRLSSPSN